MFRMLINFFIPFFSKKIYMPRNCRKVPIVKDKGYHGVKNIHKFSVIFELRVNKLVILTFYKRFFLFPKNSFWWILTTKLSKLKWNAQLCCRNIDEHFLDEFNVTITKWIMLKIKAVLRLGDCISSSIGSFVAFGSYTGRKK